MEIMVKMKDSDKEHYLLDKWNCWAHLPQDNNWGLSSYKKITCMRDGINPYWEDPKNIKGGCFSYKVNYKCVNECWKNLSYLLLGETLTNENVSNNINGITISPKKNFCIVKIWLNTCDYMDVNIIKDIQELPKHGAFFKKHISE